MNQSGRDEDLFNYVRDGEEIIEDNNEKELQYLAQKCGVVY